MRNVILILIFFLPAVPSWPILELSKNKVEELRAFAEANSIHLRISEAKTALRPAARNTPDCDQVKQQYDLALEDMEGIREILESIGSLPEELSERDLETLSRLSNELLSLRKKFALEGKIKRVIWSPKRIVALSFEWNQNLGLPLPIDVTFSTEAGISPFLAMTHKSSAVDICLGEPSLKATGDITFEYLMPFVTLDPIDIDQPAPKLTGKARTVQTTETMRITLSGTAVTL